MSDLYSLASSFLFGTAAGSVLVIAGREFDKRVTKYYRDQADERRRRNLRAALPGHIEGHHPRARHTADGLRWDPWCSCGGGCVKGPKHGYDHRIQAVNDAARQLEKRRNAA